MKGVATFGAINQRQTWTDGWSQKRKALKEAARVQPACRPGVPRVYVMARSGPVSSTIMYVAGTQNKLSWGRPTTLDLLASQFRGVRLVINVLEPV